MSRSLLVQVVDEQVVVVPSILETYSLSSALFERGRVQEEFDAEYAGAGRERCTSRAGWMLRS
jgi:hypothetical protein